MLFRSSRIKLLLDERTPIYSSVARFTVATDGLTAEKVAEDVLALVQDGGHA